MARIITLTLGALIVAGCGEVVEPVLQERLPVARFDNGTSDVDPPELTGFSFTPMSVDVSESAAIVDVTISATDAGVGVQGVNPNFVSPGGGQGASCVANTPSSGTANDGTWTCRMTIPQFSEAGEWHISALLLSDDLGNRRVLSETELSELSFNTKLQVTSTRQDATPPELTGLSFSPTSVDVSQAAATIDVTISATDAGVGVQGVNPNFVSPSSGQGASCVANPPSSGTPNDGTWSCQMTIPQFSEAGEWHVSGLLLSDDLGNRRVLSEAELNELGYNTRLMVTNTIPVTIDIMPGSSSNTINLKKKGLIPVAILSTTGFDATSDVNRTTLSFGRTGNEASWARCQNEAQDVDGNGSNDLVCYFRSPDTGFRVGDTIGILRGRLTSGQRIEGTDAISVR